MLESLHLHNFRSFEDTKKIGLRKLNVFIGANNAGKTSFLSCIELLVRSMNTPGSASPLDFSGMPNFSSFDSVLRRHWSTSEQRPHSFALSYEWSEPKTGGKILSSTIICHGSPKDDRIVIRSVNYDVGGNKFKIMPLATTPRSGSVAYVKVKGKKRKKTELFYHGLFPIMFNMDMAGLRPFYPRRIEHGHCEVVHPFRPVPKSFYVLDDPSLGTDDRELLTFLLRIWDSRSPNDIAIKKRLVGSLNALRLARRFDVVPISKLKGPKVVEIRVAPTMLRHTVTIADAGFGLSQALPLVACDARLSNGYFVAYQPEVHLHPLAQSRLADIFVNSVNRGNQVFIETHSPDLILRLQAKIAKGELTARDVGVFCFENVNGRSVIRSVAFDGKGVPAFPWPTGFLDTSLNLARELAVERIKKSRHAS